MAPRGLVITVPITITVPSGTSIIGPGAPFQLSSTFVGPLPSNEVWRVTVATDAEFGNIVWQQNFPASSTFLQEHLMRDFSFVPIRLVGAAAGSTVHIQAELRSSSGVDDSGTATGTWDPTAYLGTQALLIAQQQPIPTSTFTATDRTHLNSILDGITSTITGAAGTVTQTLGQLFSHRLLDLLTVSEITSGPTGAPVRSELDGFFYGIIVRVTTIPDALVPHTPDQQWYTPDLAVLRIIRGTDLQFRYGIHTPTWMQRAPWWYGSSLLDLVELGAVPPALTVAVDWAFGCEGQVFAMILP